MRYDAEYKESIEQPEKFWARQAENIKWIKKPEKILTKQSNGYYHWFEDGELNTSYLMLDHHIEEGRGDNVAIIYDSPATDKKEKITYTQLRDRVAKFAGALKNLNVGKGDTVIVYMPMIPEALVAMLACARLGAVHSVVFGGFAPHELAIRIDDCKPKAIVSASCGIEFANKIPYKPLVDKAIELATHKVLNVVILKRPELPDYTKIEGRDHDWADSVASASPADYVPVKANDPLYILYTSGTTGKPKGVERDNGSHAVALKYTMRAIYDIGPGDVYWAASDVGWVVGHSYIVYGPLLAGATTIVYEGKPIRTPDAGAFWRVISEHEVKAFFTAPTAFRAIKKEDPEGNLIKKYDLSCLRNIFVAGERLDPPTYRWLDNRIDVPIIDHWWQTETGWAIVGNMVGLGRKPIKVGSATLPSCGFKVEVLDDEGRAVKNGEVGNIVIKLPLPPGCMKGLWNDEERFVSSYLDAFKGYYTTSDGGYIDKDGYVFIMGRTDDVINVAGHRLSTGEMEELIGKHPAIAECAVVGIEDDLKGQVPVGFVVLKDGYNINPDGLENELVQIIRTEIGGIACFRQAAVVKRLPKTRSGKILRKTIRKLADEENVSVPPTIDDPTILDEIRTAMMEKQIGKANQTEGL